MATWIVSGVLLVIVAAVIAVMVKDRKAGKAPCGGDCSKCHGCH